MTTAPQSTPLHVIVGAGAVGTALARELVTTGARVRILTRSGSGPDHPAIERIALDVAAASTPGPAADRLAELTRDAVAIHNCANPAYHRWPTDWPPIANALLAAAESSGAVLVTCSNLYAYHPDDTLRASTSGAGMTEDLPLTNPGRKGGVRARMWADALAAHTAGRIRATEVRASDYLGATAASALGDQVVPRLLAGKPGRVLGDPDVPHAVTYVGDVARLMAVVATDPRAWGRPWHVPTHPARTVRQIVTDLAEVAGVPDAGVQQLPVWFQRALGLVLPFMRELPEVAYQHTTPWRVDSSAAEQTFGLAPTPWQEILVGHLTPYLAAQGAAKEAARETERIARR